jgi:hypothetical protein
MRGVVTSTHRLIELEHATTLKETAMPELTNLESKVAEVLRPR